MKLSSGYLLAPIVVILCLLAAPVADAKTVVRTGEYISLGDKEEIEGDFYAVGNTVSVSGAIDGDLHAAGGSITLNGSVSEDVLLVAGTVALHASTSDDVRIIAGDVTIADAVGGSVAVIAGRVKILSTASITGDLLVYGGDVTVEGNVSGQVLGHIERLRIDGVVAGGLDVVTRTITLGERADIGGDVRYQSDADLVRAPGAVVEGDMIPVDKAVISGTTPLLAVKVHIVFFLVILFSALTFFLLARRALGRFVAVVDSKPLIHGLVGMASLIVAPFIATLLLATILGSLVGVLIFGVIILGLIVALPLGVVYAGVLVRKYVTKRPEIDLIAITMGAILVCLLSFIPVIGFLCVMALVFITFGAIVHHIYSFLRTEAS